MVCARMHCSHSACPVPASALPVHRLRAVSPVQFYVVIWDLRKCSVVQSFGGPDSAWPIGPLKAFAVNAERNHILCVGKSTNLFRCSDTSNSEPTRLPVAVSNLLYNPTYGLIIGAMADSVRLWQAESGELQTVYNEVCVCVRARACVCAVAVQVVARWAPRAISSGGSTKNRRRPSMIVVQVHGQNRMSSSSEPLAGYISKIHFGTPSRLDAERDSLPTARMALSRRGNNPREHAPPPFAQVSDCYISAMDLCNDNKDLVIGNIEGIVRFVSLLNGLVYLSITIFSADPVRSVIVTTKLVRLRAKLLENSKERMAKAANQVFCIRFRAPVCRGLFRDASEGKGPQRRPQMRLDRLLEEVAKAVGGGYCRLQMPLRLALGVRETAAGHALAALVVVGRYLTPFPRIRGPVELKVGTPLHHSL